MPGVNEDLGATAVFGSQLANLMPEPKYDGVLGMWYGKGPGVDRSGDIFKHANFAGVGRHGGVLAVAGDDPISKSSTLPTHSEVALFDARMPILYPGNAREVIEYGRYGFELSRYCGCWVGFKIVTDVADGFSTVDVSPIADVKRPDFTFNGQSWQHLQSPALLAPFSLQMEREIQLCRLEAARLFATENHLNQIAVSSPQDRIGLVAAGKTYYDLHQALGKLGLTDDDLRRFGIRLLKVGMIHPLEPALIREFARGLVEVFVVEEKRAFVELFLRDELYNLPDRPLILGKKDETGQFLFPAYDELDADSIAPDTGAPAGRKASQRTLECGRVGAPVPFCAARPSGRSRPQPLLLLGLPPQPLYRGSGRVGGGRGYRLSRHGIEDVSQHTGNHPHGRRRRAVGGRLSLQRCEPHVPESGRRNFLPFGTPGGQAGRRGRNQHHLQDSVQLSCRNDRRSTGRRCHVGACPDTSPGSRGGRQKPLSAVTICSSTLPTSAGRRTFRCGIGIGWRKPSVSSGKNRV